MKRCTQLIVTPIVPALVITLPLPGGGEAYIDAGSGSVILQMGIAGAVGVVFAVKLFWSRIGSFFRNLLSSGTKR